MKIPTLWEGVYVKMSNECIKVLDKFSVTIVYTYPLIQGGNFGGLADAY